MNVNINFFLIFSVILFGSSIIPVNAEEQNNISIRPVISNLPEKEIKLGDLEPIYIEIDEFGNPWFTVWNETAVFQYIPENDTLITHDLPDEITPYALRFDNGTLWITDYDLEPDFSVEHFDFLVSYEINSKNVTMYKVPTSNGGPLEMLVTNKEVWFSEFFANKIGRLNFETNEIEEYQLDCDALVCGPIGMNYDNEGNFWYIDTYTNQLVQFDYITNTSVRYDVPDNVISPVVLKKDGDGNFWSGAHGGNNLFVFNPSTKEFTTYLTRRAYTADTYPIAGINDFEFDSNGDIWFSEHFANLIGRIHKNTLHEYQIDFPRPFNQWIAVDNTTIWMAKEGESAISYFDAADVPLAELSIEGPSQLKQRQNGVFTLSVTLENGKTGEMNTFGEITPQVRAFSFKSKSKAQVLEIGKTLTFEIEVEFEHDEIAKVFDILLGVTDGETSISQTFTLEIIDNPFSVVEKYYAIVVFWILIFIAIKRTAKNSKTNDNNLNSQKNESNSE